MVAQITGVRVQETVPDEVLVRARPDRTDRLVAGGPHPAAEGRQGLSQRAGGSARSIILYRAKLTALREMTLRTAAGRVDADMLGLMRDNAVKGVWPTQERILICINEAPAAKTLVRTGKRMAERARLP